MAAAADTAKPRPKTSPKSIKFLFGGLAGMGATVFVQPLDLVKNRMQLSGQGSKAREYKTSFHAVASILRNEGIGGIYTGLSAGLLRQATYTTTRLGIYTVLFERLSKADGTPPNFLMKALIGMTAGATGAFVGTPAEVALIRMTADGRLPADQRRGYTNVFNALIRITREEGVTTLWRGCIPTMARAVVVNAAQLASYSQSKQALLDSGYFRDDILCHFCASMISGLVTTAASMPVDIVKTRIQNMRMIDGKPEYKNGLEFAPSDEELEAYRKGEEWNPQKAEERRRLKEQAALEMEEASHTQKRPASPNSNYRDKYSHLIGTSAAKDAAHTLQANQTYGCVPVANKRDTRSIEEAMNEIRAKKRLKKGEEEATGSGSSV
uniref:Mitochondrial 2-oxoglutarate/malate carrier protein n=1 Tax=Cyprinus carpio carpio TaxID=630221 RepID=A0A8C1FPK6_CYPCA